MKAKTVGWRGETVTGIRTRPLRRPVPSDAIGRTATDAAAVAFIATKPIQIITSMILAQQFAPRPASLCVVPSFAGADGFLERIRQYPTPFAHVFSAHSRATAIVHQALRGHDQVLFDSDVGAKTTFAMWLAQRLRPTVRFAIFEEGTSLFDPLAIERPSEFHIRLGATARMGTGVRTEAVYTYSPEELRTKLPGKPVRQIETSIAAFVSEQQATLASVFWPSQEEDTHHWHGARCCVYLSAYNVDPRALEYLGRTRAYTVLKLHPHFRNDPSVPEIRVDQRISAGIPAELVLNKLASSFESVEVLHAGSAIERYLAAPNVRFLRVDDVTGQSAIATATRSA